MCGFCTSSAALSHISASIPSADCQARSPDCVQMTWTTRSWRDSDPPYPCRAAGAARLVSSRIDTLSVRLAHCHVTGTVTAILAGGRSSPTASRSTFSGNPPPSPLITLPFFHPVPPTHFQQPQDHASRFTTPTDQGLGPRRLPCRRDRNARLVSVRPRTALQAARAGPARH